AAHVADISKGIKDAMDKDMEMARARKNLDWERQINLAIDPIKAKRMREESKITSDKCTMCGEYCAIDVSKKYLKTDKTSC
ncbi:MAG: phosphomethylpyrimidine synthase ThiC, partial [Candidatus Humimicrobiaceae bacterium]